MKIRYYPVCGILLLWLLVTPTFLSGQTTVSQGSIQGTITDPTGAVVGGADIVITNKTTGQVVHQTSTTSGAFNSGALLPGEYRLRVAAPGFRTMERAVTVQVAVTANGNVKMELGEASQIVEVQGSAVQVNTEQSTVQGVLTANQIDNLPVDGRNFLDLAQLEPGVQIQDGQTFDPTKAGYSSVSINGVFGRTPRIELDGLDISDENVGTTTQNIALSSISEFNISRSNLDLSTELTSSGAVNVSTRSGSNDIHGQAFYAFRGRDTGTAAFPGDLTDYYQRNNFGGRVGGALIKDKLFYFIDGERMKQDGFLPVVVPSPFSSLSGGFLSPFRDTALTGKLDWQATKDIHVFYRFTYNWNKSEANFGYDYQVYANRDNTPSHAVGVDWNQGSWSHSFRFGYLKFHNLIGDATSGAPFYNPIPDANILFFDLGTNGSLAGPNLLAPQQTFQSNKQLKYDGSKVWGKHIFRYGVGVNDINGGGFASFFGIAPQLVAGSFTGPVSGSPSDPLNYPLLEAILGNGQGFFTEKPNFGFPAGGQHDWRFQWYVGDSYKLKPNLTLTYGLRYNRDTGRSDADLAPIPCSSVTVTPAPCTGSAPLLNQWGTDPQGLGLGAQVRQPNSQFGPQIGFAWDPSKNGKTVIRGGAGIYYENSIFNNTLFDRPAKLPVGLFFQDSVLACSGTTPGSVSFNVPGTGNVTSVNGVDLATGVCNAPLSTAGPLVAALQSEYQAGTAAQGPTANPSFVGNTLMISTPLQDLSAFDPNYRNARSYQFNIGMQRELVKGGILSVDYIRNVSTHFMLTIDANHVGDSRYLDVSAAQAAMSKTTAAFGCGGGFSSTAVDCAISAGATINDFAGNGLDSGNALGGGPASITGAAFGGVNRNVGQGDFEMPIGRSTYNALQTSYKQQIGNPMPGVASMDLTIAYTLSRYVGDGGNDQFFSAIAFDNNNPGYFTGPTSLDRLNQFKFGLTTNIAHHGPQFSVIGNFSGAPPSTLLLASQGSPAENSTGEIFRTDLTGDGTVQDPLPTGSGQAAGKPGQFMRSVSPTSLTNVINNWNGTQAGTLTPAGLALVSAGLFTSSQLQQLQAVKPYVAAPPPGEVGNGGYREVSMVLAWPIKITERIQLQPSVSAYNVFNFANFGRLDGLLVNSTDPAAIPPGPAGNVNGTARGFDRESVRTGIGSGVFSQGAPRQMEFGLRINF